MKKLIYAAIVALVVPTLSEAQDKTSYSDRVQITPYELAQRGDSLYIHIELTMDEMDMEKRTTMELTPVLSNGTQSQNLHKVSFKGKRQYKEYKRQQALMNRRERAAYAAPYVVEKEVGNKSTVNYRYAIPYQPWMNTAYLVIRRDWCGCGNSTRQTTMERVIDRVSIENKSTVEPYTIMPHLVYIPTETISKSSIVVAVAKTDISTDFGDNLQELQKIQDMFENISVTKGATIRNIDITGYASPEGSLALNIRLSEGRAKELQKYLQTRYDIPKEQYTIRVGGEDWEGLVELINRSEMEYKQQVLDLIENTTIEQGRETKLMALADGKPYKYMLQNMFPQLRRINCKVDYDINKPEETAAQIFPNDQIANLNAAIAHLARKEIVAAEQYLDKVKTKVRIPEYDNAMGVLEMLKGNYDEAERYLNAAKSAGIAEAQQNLDEIAKKRAHVAQMAQ